MPTDQEIITSYAAQHGGRAPSGLEFIQMHKDLKDGKMVLDSGDDAISSLANDLNLKLDDSTKDAILQYYMNEQSANNAYERSLNFNKEQYSTMVEGLKKAGLNPFLAIQGLSGANQMTGQSVQGGTYTSRSNAKRQSDNAVAGSVGSSLLTALALIAVACIKFL